MDLTRLSVAVVGGGIGGMAAAAALAQRGVSVTVHEQAPALAEVGAGLQVSVNGQRVLRALGAVGKYAPAGAAISPGTVFRDGRSGRQVAHVRPPAEGATWYMHRADLLDLLVQSASKAGVTVDLGRLMGPGMLQADLIVAADGVRSLWRSEIDGPVAPHFTGQVAWRALVPWQGNAMAPASVVARASCACGRLPAARRAVDEPGRRRGAARLAGRKLVPSGRSSGIPGPIFRVRRHGRSGHRAGGDGARLGAAQPRRRPGLGQGQRRADRRCGPSDLAVHGARGVPGAGRCLGSWPMRSRPHRNWQMGLARFQDLRAFSGGTRRGACARELMAVSHGMAVQLGGVCYARLGCRSAGASVGMGLWL